jgi:mRNA-degrading endonuclease toxin of MazEF toxin-antitoxin module
MSKQGKVFWVELPWHEKSHIQGGTRPCVVITPDWIKHSGVVTVCPLSTKLDEFEFHPRVFVGGKQGQVLCDQVTTIDVQDIGDYVGKLRDEEFVKVKLALFRLNWCDEP